MWGKGVETYPIDWAAALFMPMLPEKLRASVYKVQFLAVVLFATAALNPKAASQGPRRRAVPGIGGCLGRLRFGTG